MILGEKIKILRIHKGMTQEAFAEKLNVSRSTIAKWESSGGIPEISNLKVISKIFHLSIDELIDDTKSIDFTNNKVEGKFKQSTFVCDGQLYDIDVKGWSNGVFDALIIGEDSDFLFYKILNKKIFNKNEETFGFIGKKHITTKSISKKSNNFQNGLTKIERSYFIRKHVFIELSYKQGFLKGFFDFHNDDYLDVIIHSFSESSIELEYGREIAIACVTKLEIL